jgi:hypothetical protein
MKKLILLIAFPTLLIAQQPFGYHATWHFNYYENGYSGFKKITHVSDTTMLGLNWLKFEVTGVSEIRTGPNPNDIIQTKDVKFDPLYLATKNDSVYRLLNDSTPYLLYDFSAGLGDKWQFAPHDTSLGCDSLPIASVSKVGMDVFGSDTVSYIEVGQALDTSGTRYSASLIMPDKIYRKFGSEYYTLLFEVIMNACNGVNIDYFSGYSLRCFSDDEVSINFTNQACDAWNYISLEELATKEFKIYPNPANGVIGIFSEEEVVNIIVFDLSGQKVNEVVKDFESVELPEKSGLYMLVATFKDGGKATRKVMRL